MQFDQGPRGYFWCYPQVALTNTNQDSSIKNTWSLTRNTTRAVNILFRGGRGDQSDATYCDLWWTTVVKRAIILYRRSYSDCHSSQFGFAAVSLQLPFLCSRALRVFWYHRKFTYLNELIAVHFKTKEELRVRFKHYSVGILRKL